MFDGDDDDVSDEEQNNVEEEWGDSSVDETNDNINVDSTETSDLRVQQIFPVKNELLTLLPLHILKVLIFFDAAILQMEQTHSLYINYNTWIFLRVIFLGVNYVKKLKKY